MLITSDTFLGVGGAVCRRWEGVGRGAGTFFLWERDAGGVFRRLWGGGLGCGSGLLGFRGSGRAQNPDDAQLLRADLLGGLTARRKRQLRGLASKGVQYDNDGNPNGAPERSWGAHLLWAPLGYGT